MGGQGHGIAAILTIKLGIKQFRILCHDCNLSNKTNIRILNLKSGIHSSRRIYSFPATRSCPPFSRRKVRFIPPNERLKIDNSPWLVREKISQVGAMSNSILS